MHVRLQVSVCSGYDLCHDDDDDDDEIAYFTVR